MPIPVPCAGNRGMRKKELWPHETCKPVCMGEQRDVNQLLSVVQYVA